MRTIDELFDSDIRFCYWLNESQPSPNCPDRFLVCFVFENEPGYWSTGKGDNGGDCAFPWYWNSATCAERNRKLGLTEDDVTRIVESSMFATA